MSPKKDHAQMEKKKVTVFGRSRDSNNSLLFSLVIVCLANRISLMKLADRNIDAHARAESHNCKSYSIPSCIPFPAMSWLSTLVLSMPTFMAASATKHEAGLKKKKRNIRSFV